MPLHDIMRPEDLLLQFHAADKWDAIERMMAHLTAAERVDRVLAPEVLEAVLARERSMSTGMERGLAIPHAAVDGLEKVVVCLAVLEEGGAVPFDSIDHSDTEIVVLLLIPRAQKLLHIRTLANIARVLGRDDVRAALRAANSPQEAWEALAAAD